MEEAGYEQGDYSEFIEGIPNIVDEAFQQTNNGVQSPIQNLNITPSISHGRKCTPKRIQVDESALSSMEGKMPRCTIRCHCSEIIRQYFEPKSDARKCQLFLSLLKSKSFSIGTRILGIKTLKNTE